MSKVHYVYKVINLINGMFYIGKHSSDNIEDEYLGSGIELSMAIQEYGKENFSKSIIEFCETELDAYKLEAQLVTLEQVKDKMCYNMVVGGYGAGSGEDHHMYGKTHSPEARAKISAGNRGRAKTAKERVQISTRQQGIAPTAAIAAISRRVIQKDKVTGEHIQTFASISAAKRALGKGSNANISLCARGLQKAAYGYKWEYET